MEIHITNLTTCTAMIELLRKSFAALGYQKWLFLTMRPPYHPASNGLVERAVQTFRTKWREAGSLSTGVSQFLFKYCITPHSTTGLSLADRVVVGQEVVLVRGRKLCSQMDLVHPDLDRRLKIIRNKDMMFMPSYEILWWKIRCMQGIMDKGSCGYHDNWLRNWELCCTTF